MGRIFEDFDRALDILFEETGQLPGPCETCNGEGYIYGDSYEQDEECSVCGGTGYIDEPEPVTYGPDPMTLSKAWREER